MIVFWLCIVGMIAMTILSFMVISYAVPIATLPDLTKCEGIQLEGAIEYKCPAISYTSGPRGK